MTEQKRAKPTILERDLSTGPSDRLRALSEMVIDNQSVYRFRDPETQKRVLLIEEDKITNDQALRQVREQLEQQQTS
jgi:hypothetical protein